jgi:hypothetical protein
LTYVAAFVQIEIPKGEYMPIPSMHPNQEPCESDQTVRVSPNQGGLTLDTGMPD